MAKRSASSSLNKDNWDEEEVAENMGVFQKAAPTELKMRQIKRAKRRGGATDDGERDSIFKNFTAFGATNTESSAPTFSFLSGDSAKPKLTNLSPFPSFSFSSASDSNKTDKPSDPITTSPEKSATIPNFTFNTSSNSKEAKPKETFNLSSNENGEETSKNIKFSFGVASKDVPNKSAIISPYNPIKTSDSTAKSPESSSFKFGINNKNTETTKTPEPFTFKSDDKKEKEVIKSPLPFQFGSQSKTNSNNSSSSPFNTKSDHSKGSPSDKGKETPKSSKLNGVESNSDSLSGKNKLFLANLKALNTGVLNWVKQHVEKNRYINLSPIFDDYKEHFQEIKDKYDSSNLNKSTTSDETKGTSKSNYSTSKSTDSKIESKEKEKPITETPKSLFTFGGSSSSNNVFGNAQSPPSFSSSITKPNETSKTPEVKLFSFGLTNTKSSVDTPKTDSTESTNTTPFSFGLKDKASPSLTFGSSDNKPFSFGSSENKASSGFSFGGSKETKSPGFSFDSSSNNGTTATSGFSFKTDSSSTFATPSTNNDTKKDMEEEVSDEVPKVEVIEVKEDDAIYEKKVKLFYKKADKFVDRGVGTLFLKPAGEKTQLLIRALTNLGNILLNLILNDAIPTQRVGKNNVLIGCVPNPPIDLKDATTAVSMLIRVKTESDADELLEKINEHKN